MKKILLLGGSRYLLPVIDAIHKLGYYAVTCDYLPDNIAHKYSDEYHNVSIIDKEKVLELASVLKIDGIMSFACDPGVVTAAYVAEKMGLPTNPYQSVELLQNKALFRKFLKDNGFNVPKANGYSDIEAAVRDVDSYKWPIIVKPVDSAGSKGVKRVNRADGVKYAAEYALRFSRCGRFIIEEYIEQKGFSSDTDCFSINGELVYASFNNQMFDRAAVNPYTPAAFSWPSLMPNEIQCELRTELQRLMKLLNLGTSIYNVETRQGMDGKPYIMEVSPRGGGNRLAEVLRYATGTDLITNAVRAAVGDRIEGIVSDPVYDGNWAEVILHAEKDGIFDSLWIDPVIEDSIVERDLWVTPGDIVHGFMGANEAIGTLIFCFKTCEKLEKSMKDIKALVQVIVK